MANRAERRRAARQTPRQDRGPTFSERLMSTTPAGFYTLADLQAEYKKGFKRAEQLANEWSMRMFYSAVCIALHRRYKFGEARCSQVLRDAYALMLDHLPTELLEIAKNETGVDIVVYNSEEMLFDTTDTEAE